MGWLSEKRFHIWRHYKATAHPFQVSSPGLNISPLSPGYTRVVGRIVKHKKRKQSQHPRRENGWNTGRVHWKGVWPCGLLSRHPLIHVNPDRKIHGADVGPTWGRQDPGGPMLAPWTLLSGKLPQLIWRSGARPTNGISIEFKIQWNFVMLLFIPYLADRKEVLHTSRQ